VSSAARLHERLQFLVQFVQHGAVLRQLRFEQDELVFVQLFAQVRHIVVRGIRQVLQEFGDLIWFSSAG